LAGIFLVICVRAKHRSRVLGWNVVVELLIGLGDSGADWDAEGIESISAAVGVGCSSFNFLAGVLALKCFVDFIVARSRKVVLLSR
jgi:hypothetical protein